MTYNEKKSLYESIMKEEPLAGSSFFAKDYKGAHGTISYFVMSMSTSPSASNEIFFAD